MIILNGGTYLLKLFKSLGESICWGRNYEDCLELIERDEKHFHAEIGCYWELNISRSFG